MTRVRAARAYCGRNSGHEPKLALGVGSVHGVQAKTTPRAHGAVFWLLDVSFSKIIGPQ